MASPSLPPTATASQANNGDSGSTAPLAGTANGSVLLPHDLLYEILLRLPAKAVCRLRAVSRSWRLLLSDPSFVAAHKDRHQHHLLVADIRWETSAEAPRVDFHIMDTSGHRARRIRFDDNPHAGNPSWSVACRNQGQLICLIGADNRARVIDPATGVVFLLPDDRPDDHHYHHYGYSRRFALGRSSTTGETKVLVVAGWYAKVLTLGDGAGKWRKTGYPPVTLATSPRSVALVKGVLYFLAHKHVGIAAYDLEEEKWRPDLLNLPLLVDGDIALAELSDSLVAVYGRSSIHDCSDVFMDMWFLTDSEEVPWSNRYTITLPYQDQGCRSPCGESRGHPLWELDDGRILLWVSNDKTLIQLLQVYDPRTNTYTDGVEMSCHSMIGVYKGSLLAGLPWIRNYGFFGRIKRAYDYSLAAIHYFTGVARSEST
ncbi:hypothetical protein VPH35_024195 [Triticum aestivum]